MKATDTANPSVPSRFYNSISNQRGSSSVAVLLLIVILGVLLMSTKPNEIKIRTSFNSAFLSEQADGLLITVKKLFGDMDLTYNDYILVSTLTVKEEGKPPRLGAVGVGGQVFTCFQWERLKLSIAEKIDETPDRDEPSPKIDSPASGKQS